MPEIVFTFTLLEQWQLALVQSSTWEQGPLKESFARARKESKKNKCIRCNNEKGPSQLYPFHVSV